MQKNWWPVPTTFRLFSIVPPPDEGSGLTDRQLGTVSVSTSLFVVVLFVVGFCFFFVLFLFVFLSGGVCFCFFGVLFCFCFCFCFVCLFFFGGGGGGGRRGGCATFPKYSRVSRMGWFLTIVLGLPHRDWSYRSNLVFTKQNLQQFECASAGVWKTWKSTKKKLPVSEMAMEESQKAWQRRSGGQKAEDFV